MDIEYVFTAKRSAFGAPCVFTDVGPHMLIDIDPDPSLYDDYVQLPTAEKAVLCRSEMAAHDVGTLSNPTVDKKIKHDEGGWPAGIDHRDDDQVTRFKRRVEKDEGYTKALKAASKVILKLLKENEAFDIYEDYFSKEGTEQRIKDLHMRSASVYRYTSEQAVVCLSWSADCKNIAVAYSYEDDSSNLNSDSATDIAHQPNDLFNGCVWDINNSLEPNCFLKPDFSVLCFAFSPKDINILVGGYDNGQIGFWDLNKSDSPLNVTPIESSHQGSVTDIKWLNSKCGAEFISVSIDAQIMSWDIREMAEPTATLQLEIEDDDSSITCFDYDPSVAHRLLVGTGGGKIMCINRRARKEEDSDEVDENRIISIFEAGTGPILMVERNSYIPKLFFSATAFAIQLWSEDHICSPLIILMSQRDYITQAVWCPTRPSVIFASKTDGVLEAWDITLKREEPVACQKLDHCPITCLRFSNADKDGTRHVACGLANGTVHLLELSKDFGLCKKQEKTFLAWIMDTETKREKLLEPKSREERLIDQEEKRKSIEKKRYRDLQIPPEWSIEDFGEETYSEMEKLEFGTGFLDKNELEDDIIRRARQLKISEEFGEREFLKDLEADSESKKVVEETMRQVTHDVEGDTSLFPLEKISVESEYGEEKFLKELEDYQESKSLLEDMVEVATNRADRKLKKKMVRRVMKSKDA